MRTRKMRFVSGLLALAMMFVMMPVGAFADGTGTEDDNKASGMILDASGYVDMDKCNLTLNAVDPNKDRYDGHGWYIRKSSQAVWIVSSEFDKTSYSGSETVQNYISNYGTIRDGNFALVVNTKEGALVGKIEGGRFTRISNSSSVNNAVMET